MVAFLAGDPGRRALAGDQLYLDLDLSHDNLPVGTRLTIGDPAVRGAVIEVTAPPHTGCAKFVERFGAEAMRFVNGTRGPADAAARAQRPGRRARPGPSRRPGPRHPPLTPSTVGLRVPATRRLTRAADATRPRGIQCSRVSHERWRR